MRSAPRLLVLLLASAAPLCACDARPAPYDDHASDPAGGGHHHAAPRGGTLVALEAEVFNAELLLDATTGRLTVWFLDGHCENPVRLTQPNVELTLTIGGAAEALRLDAVEDALTGEKRGDASQFAGQSDSLRGAARFSGVIRSVRLGQRAFESVAFEYAQGSK